MGGRIEDLRTGWQGFRESILYRLLMRQRSWVIWLFITAIMAFLAAAGMADTMRKIVDDSIIDHTTPLQDNVDKLVFFSIFTFVWGLALRQVIARIGYHLEFELRIWLYERLQSTDPSASTPSPPARWSPGRMTDLLLLELVILVAPTVIVVSLIIARRRSS